VARSEAVRGATGALARPSWAGAAAIGGGLQSEAWLAWLAAASIAVFLTSNPLYLATACLVGLVVYSSLPGGRRRQAYSLIVKIGVLFALLSIPFNLLTGSAGASVLFSLPRLTFPGWLGGATLGGDATAESLVYAGSRALRLIALVLFAAAFNVGVNHYRLLRLMPAALKQVGVVVTVAVLLIPQALVQTRALAEAQRLRGRRVRGVRSIAGLTVPVLAGALERSIQRAESLDARGFGALGPAVGRRSRRLSLLAISSACLAALGGFGYFYYGGTPLFAVAALAAGMAAAVLAVRSQGKGLAASHYSQEPLTRPAVAVAACSLSSLALFLGLRVLDAGDVSYFPFPSIQAPDFHPLAVFAALLLLSPAFHLVWGAGSAREAEDD